jgi:hypothetical protein
MKLLWLLTLCPLLSFGQCILSDQVTVNPAPVGGQYQPGTVVTFTYTVSAYQGLSVNWMHGIAVNAGPGWTAITPVGTPTNNSGGGTWLWVNSVTSSATGITVSRPGWFYDSGLGGPLDGNPGNNYGDGLTGPWTFRWRATVVGCPPGQDGATLSLIIENYADGETGSWINYDCQGDPNESFQATLDCCQPFVTGQILHN